MSKPLLTIRCISCDQEFAWVRVIRQPDKFKDIIGSVEWPGDGVQTMVEFRTIRQVLKVEDRVETEGGELGQGAQDLTSQFAGLPGDLSTAGWAPDAERAMVEFKEARRNLQEGKWRTTKRGRCSLFQEPLDPEGHGRTKAYCNGHSYWLEHAELREAIRKGVRVLKRVPASHLT